MNIMDKSQIGEAWWLLAKDCMKKCPVAYKRILAERNALKSELEVADAEMQNLRNHAYVLAGNKPFSGQEVLALLNENNELRKAATKALEWFASYPFGNRAFESMSATDLYHELSATLTLKDYNHD